MANVYGVCNEIQMEPFEVLSNNDRYTLRSPFNITIPIDKITSGDTGRDEHIQEILGHPKFPTIQIKIESVNFSENKYKVNGTLSIRGITKEFSSEANVDLKAPKEIQIDGKVFTKFSDFNLENPSLLFFKAKETIEISYSFLIKLK